MCSEWKDSPQTLTTLFTGPVAAASVFLPDPVGPSVTKPCLDLRRGLTVTVIFLGNGLLSSTHA